MKGTEERERAGGERYTRTERELREPASCCTLVGATPRISHEMTYMRGFFVMVISFSFFSFLALVIIYSCCDPKTPCLFSRSLVRFAHPPLAI